MTQTKKKTSLSPEIIAALMEQKPGLKAEQASETTNIAPAEERKITERSQRMGDILVRMGRLSDEQVKEIVVHQKKSGELFGKTARKLGFVSAQEIQAALAVQFGYFHADPNNISIPPKLVTITRPFSQETEQFRMLRTRLLSQSGGAASRLLAITGATANVGAAYTTANLAITFAQANRKTLLIDTDLRTPHLESIFKVKPELGLGHYLNGECTLDEAKSSSQIRNLTLVTSGGRVHNPQELLGRPQFVDLILGSLDHYDSVLVHTPGGADVADGQFVWSLTKSVLLLARKNVTKAKEAQATSDLIRECGAHIVGSILTGG